MQQENFQVLSSTDGLSLKGTLFYPEEGIKGVFLVAHGMCEHKERYFDFLKYMAEQGFACGIYDHRGHGESIREESDLGYFYRDGKKGIVEDLQDVVLFMKKKFAVREQGLKFFLLGHSMGSMVVRCYLKLYDRELDGLVVVGSPSKRAGITLGKGIVRCMQNIKGSHAHSGLIDYLAVNSSYESCFAKEKLPHAWICSDRKVVEAYNLDPKCNFTFTINGYRVLFYLLGRTYSKNGYSMAKPELPVRFLAGSEDPCIINEKGFRKAIYHLKNAGYTNVTGKLYGGMRHEILNEKDRIYVYKDIRDFLVGIM